jgi:UDP-galactopyranose mutase
LSRFAKDRRVFFIEEPVFHDAQSGFDVSKRDDGLHVVVPRLQSGMPQHEIEGQLRSLIDRMVDEHQIEEYVSWYYTPMMLGWSRHLNPRAVIYDCMDELSAFRNAPAELIEKEVELLELADHVFTGGRSLYESKRDRHPSVHCFPSSIDVAHFSTAKSVQRDPDDQRAIPHPRIGFFGVIDERSDLELLDRIAELRPEWHYVMIGPVVKIDESDLPRRENIHYLGGKNYSELPDYVGGWEVAMMPFALNESTRFISPTKTPEYLAAGLPVVSTPVKDVVRPYGDEGLVHIAFTPDDFVEAIETAMSEDGEDRDLRVREFLSDMSWDKTQRAMSELLEQAAATQKAGSAVASGV